MKKKKKSKGFIAGIVVIAAAIAGLFLAGNITSSLVRTLVTIGIGAAMVICVIMMLIVLFARKASQDSKTSVSSNEKPLLTPEQTKSLEDAHSQLVEARMTISRFQNSALRQAGNEATESMDKVLQTLKQKPEKIQTSRQLFNYYIPTLEKVVSRYQRVEESKIENAEMTAKLGNYFSDVKSAMGNLYEGLFDNDKLNAAVDMEAMTIAIKRDGLLDEEDFDTETIKEGTVLESEF